MATHTKNKRRGGKEKTLFHPIETSVSFSAEDTPEQLRRDIEALKTLHKAGSLKARLKTLEKTAAAILKEHNLPDNLPDLLESTKTYDLPLPASYAADILFHVQATRDWTKKGNAKNAAIEALKLGWNAAALQAELAAGGREQKQTRTATGTRATAKQIRRQRLMDIATEKGWKRGREFNKTELQAVYTLLRERHPEYATRPNKSTLSGDALAIGLRKKK